MVQTPGSVHNSGVAVVLVDCVLVGARTSKLLIRRKCSSSPLNSESNGEFERELQLKSHHMWVLRFLEQLTATSKGLDPHPVCAILAALQLLFRM